MKSEASGKSVAAIIVCAGRGSRTNLSYNKILYYIGKKTILETTLDKFALSGVSRICLVIAKQDESKILQLVAPYSNVEICYGGETRSDSVINGLRQIGNCDIVVIHDGARPYVSPSVIDASILSAIEHGSGIVAVPTIDTIKEVSGGIVTRTLPRDSLYNIQTPQSFIYSEICDAYNKVSGAYNDDSEVYERAGYIPYIVMGDYKNSKVTSASDLMGVATNCKIGVGFDVHALVADRPLIIGGVTIQHCKGLLGHSDADVLTHAIMDALLSAASLPDIGVLFSDQDDEFLGISSLTLLARVMKLIYADNYKVSNISAVIMAQQPKMCPHISLMREKLSGVIGISVERIDISATTTEHLGIIGEEKGIAASASCILTK